MEMGSIDRRGKKQVNIRYGSMQGGLDRA